ncbi:hypothetical protein M3Y97_00744900 [Aphelenchoides bicaudatus]|nr:hypothetical protein M3Y97_00744900 [Aphelenchoides bicaudatus]
MIDTPLIQAQQPMSLIEELKLKELNFANNTLFRFLNERCQQINSNSLLQLPTPVETPILKSVSPLSSTGLSSPIPLAPIEFNSSQMHPATVLASSTASSPISSPSTSSVDSSEELENRPYKCGDCNKRFRFKSNLFEHKTLHSQSTPFICPFCSKSCRLKGNLKKHLQVHVSNSEALEQLWKARFSRSSGRPRKQVSNPNQAATNNLHPQQLPNPMPTYSIPLQTPMVPQAQTTVDFRQALFDLNSLLNFNANQQLLATAFNRL